MTDVKFNIKEEKKEESKSDCLYERFGRGVHAIRSKYSGERIIMVICNSYTDALFIYEDGDITDMPSEDGKILYHDFDECYEYLGKVKTLSVEDLENAE